MFKYYEEGYLDRLSVLGILKKESVKKVDSNASRYYRIAKFINKITVLNSDLINSSSVVTSNSKINSKFDSIFPTDSSRIDRSCQRVRF